MSSISQKRESVNLFARERENHSLACKESAACLRYGIKAKPCMESSRSDVCNQSEGGYTLTRDAIRLWRLHTHLR